MLKQGMLSGSEVTLSLRERFLLEAWLPRESPLGAPQVDVRSLVAMERTLTLEETQGQLVQVRACLRDLRSQRSMLDLRPPLGRGWSSRQPGEVTLSWLSPWEEAWLVVNRLHARGRFDLGAVQELATQLKTGVVNAMALAVLCLDTAEQGARLAQQVMGDPGLSRQDRPWILWLAGEDAPYSDGLTDETIGETPRKALVAVFQNRWSEVAELLPKNLRQPALTPIAPSGTRMHGQFLAQLSSHVLAGQPARPVLDASLTALFTFWGFDKTAAFWNGREVMSRLPLLFLYARQFEPTAKGATLLHAQRTAIPHLHEPPPQTFVGPLEVCVAVEKLEGIVATAVKEGRPLRISLAEEGNCYSLL